MLPLQQLGLLSDKALGTSDVIFVCIAGILVVMFILAILSFLVTLLSKGVRMTEKLISKKSPETEPQKAEEKSSALPKTLSQGELKLIDTDEQTAAMIMAIVSNESGIPLNRLIFKSIKKIDSETCKE